MNPVPMHSTGRSTRRKAERQSRRPTAYALANSVYAVGVGVERATRVTCARYCGSRRVRYMSRTHAGVKVRRSGRRRTSVETTNAAALEFGVTENGPTTGTRHAMSAE